MYFNNAYFILLVVSTEIWCHWYQFIFTCCCHVQGDNSLKKKKNLLILTLINTERLKHWAKKFHNNQELSSLLLLLLFYSSNQAQYRTHCEILLKEFYKFLEKNVTYIEKTPWQFLKCFDRNILKLIINMAISI